MAFINRDQTFFDQPATAWLGQSTNIVSIPNIINCTTINGGDITGGIVTPTSVNTLSNKSLVAGSTYIIDTIDPTKRITFDASAVTAGSTVLFDMVGSGTIAFPNPAGGTTTLIDSASDITITGDWTFVQPVTTLFGQVQLYVSAATSFTPDGATDYTFATAGTPSIVPPNGIFIPTAPPTTHVSWSAINNIPGMISQGTFNWKYRPNYAGVPAASTRIITQQNGGQTCLLILNHLASGALNFIMGNTISVPVISGSFFTWNGASVPSCVLGTEYDFELSYDITVSIARLFINGTLVGTLNGVPFTRNIAGSSLYVGAIDPTAVGASNFYIREIYAVVGVLHTANFVPAPPSAASMSVGSLKVTGVMPSTSPISGALTVVGGIGTSGALSSEQVSIWSPDQLTGHLDINVANITGDTTFSRATGTTRDFIFTGDAASGGVTIQSTEPQTGSSGALVVAGGIYSSDRIGCGSMVIGNPALFDPIFSASYSTSINAEVAFNPTGTPFGGAAIVNGKLDLTGGGARYVTYVAGNGAFQQTGAIHLYYTPMYAGTPPVAQFIVDFSIAGTNTNQLTLHHASMDGRIYCYIGYLGGFVAFGTSAAWVPVAGTEYEIEVDLDLIVGNVHIFVNGVRHGASIVTSLAHDHSAYVMSVGRSTVFGATDTNFLIRDLTVFSRILHTTSYTPYSVTNAIVTSGPISVGTLTATGPINSQLTTLSGNTTSGSLILNGGIGSANAYSGKFITNAYVDTSNALFIATWANHVDADVARFPIASYGNVDTHIANGQLEFPNIRAWLDYNTTNVEGLVNQGTIRCIFTPLYSGGSPWGLEQVIFELRRFGEYPNKIALQHYGGVMRFYVYASDGVTNLTVDAPLSAIAGREYEIAAQFDLTVATASLYVDGVRYTRTSAAFSRVSTVNVFRIGGEYTGDMVFAFLQNNFRLRDFMIQPSVVALSQPGSYVFTGLRSAAMSFLGDATSTSISLGNDWISRATVVISYSRTLYADIASITNYTAVGAPTITNGKLNLTGGGKAVYYNATTNLAPITTILTFRCKYTPGYISPPATTQYIFTTGAGLGTNNDRIALYHNVGTGELVFELYSSAGVLIVGGIGSGYIWTPIRGVEYEIQVCWKENSQMFINGVKVAVSFLLAGVARVAGDIFYIGDNRFAPAAAADFSIRDIVITPVCGNLRTYTPGYTTVGLESIMPANATSLYCSGPLTCGWTPASPLDVIRLSEFISFTTITPPSTGAIVSAGVPIRILKIGRIVWMTVQFILNFPPAANGAATISPIPSQYLPIPQDVAIGIPLLQNSTLLMGYANINTVTASITIEPIGGFILGIGPTGWPFDFTLTFYTT